MSTELRFPALPTKDVMGWNLRQRIKYETGLTVHYGNDGQQTIISCDSDFSEEQKAKITDIMSDPEHVFGPNPDLILPGNTIVIRDIFDYKAKVEKHCGFCFQLYYRQTPKFKGSGEQDEIWIIPCDDTYQLNRELSKDELKAFFKVYLGLARIE